MQSLDKAFYLFIYLFIYPETLVLLLPAYLLFP